MTSIQQIDEAAKAGRLNACEVFLAYTVLTVRDLIRGISDPEPLADWTAEKIIRVVKPA